jgi:hypothetical protein
MQAERAGVRMEPGKDKTTAMGPSVFQPKSGYLQIDINDMF